MKQLTLSLALALVVAVIAASPAAADGSGWPSHQIGSADCGRNSVTTRAPRVMLSSYPTNYVNPETVEWSPDLWYWNGLRWALYDGSKPWYRAFTSSYGFFQTAYTAAWNEVRTNAPLGFVTYNQLPSGYYAIKNYMRWASIATTHAEFAMYCKVG